MSPDRLSSFETSSILVLGAGELGMAVLRGLARRAGEHAGTTLTVLLRPATLRSEDLAKQRDLAELGSLGVAVLAGDLAGSSAGELAGVFGRFGTVISCTGFVGGRGTQRKLAEAVLAAGVRRYVPWQFGVEYDVIGRGSAQDLFDEQLEVRDRLRAQRATEWIILSTGMFTSFLFEPAFGVVDLAGNVVHALGGFENRVTVTTAEDIGALTAEVVFAQPRLANQVVRTAGETLTYARLADLVEAVLDRRVRRVAWSVTALRAELAEDPENALKKYRVVFAEGRGVAWEMAGTINAQRGIATTGVEPWMRENLGRFRSS